MKKIVMAGLITLIALPAFAKSYAEYTTPGPVRTSTIISQDQYFNSKQILHYFYQKDSLVFDSHANRFKCHYKEYGAYDLIDSDKEKWFTTMDNGKSLICPASVYHSAFGTDLGDPDADKRRVKDWKNRTVEGQAYANNKWETFKQMALTGDYK